MRIACGIGCAVATLVAALACADPSPPMARGGLPGEAIPAVRTGGHVAGPATPPPVAANPFDGDELALAEGRRLFVWYNCAGCHGMEGGGGMGPPLADGEWIYGGEPNNVFQSIVQGRPNGMPAYSRLSDDHVWKLVLRVRELGGLTSSRAGAAGRGADQGPGEGQAGQEPGERTR